MSVSDESFEDFPVGEVKDVTADGAVQKKVLVAGDGWDTPERLDQVTVHYVGTLHGTDDKFDSSRDRGEPFTFTLGKGEVIRGWDEGVATMRRGEKAVLTCRADAAYGASGSPPKIPPNATLDFEVELLSWRSVKDVAGDGGVIKTVLQEGEGWQTPGDADEVVVDYKVRAVAQEDGGKEGEEEGKAAAAAAADGATADAGDGADGADKKKPTGGKKPSKGGKKPAPVSDGPVLQASPDGGAVFTVREGHLCRGLARAVRTMKPGERAALRLRAADYAPELLPLLPAGAREAEVEVALRELRKVEAVEPGVVKKTMNEVDGWKRPNDGSAVRLRVRATLPRAAAPSAAAAAAAPSAAAAAPAAAAEPPVPFWERLEGDELEAVLGEGNPPHPLPEGLEDAVLKMREGERCVVTISDPELAYGAAGWPDAPLGVPVPPHAAPVEFDVELVSVTKAKEQWEMSAADKLAAAARKKDRGNAAYAAGKVRSALKHYKGAGELLALVTDRDFEDAAAGAGPPAFGDYEEPMAVDGAAEEGEKKEAAEADKKKPQGPTPAELRRAHRDLKKAVALNESAAALKAREWPLAREAATKALDVDPSNAKGLYRRAQALAALGELVEAERDVKAALDADPSSADVKALERRVRAQMREQDRKEAKMFGRMLAALGGKAAAKKGVEEEGGDGGRGGGAGADQQQEKAEAGGEGATAAPAADAPAIVEASA